VRAKYINGIIPRTVTSYFSLLVNYVDKLGQTRLNLSRQISEIAFTVLDTRSVLPLQFCTRKRPMQLTHQHMFRVSDRVCAKDALIALWPLGHSATQQCTLRH
jgi:hypothetical protein